MSEQNPDGRKHSPEKTGDGVSSVEGKGVEADQTL